MGFLTRNKNIAEANGIGLLLDDLQFLHLCPACGLMHRVEACLVDQDDNAIAGMLWLKSELDEEGTALVRAGNLESLAGYMTTAEAARAVEAEWYEIGAKPFLHGCCDCGLAHLIHWEIVDASGRSISGARLQLKFERG